MMNDGDKIKKDLTKAAKWYQRAAEQGHTNAQINLGALYATGSGVPKNRIMAYAWTYLAASNGSAMAQRNCDYAVTRMTPGEIAIARQLAAELQQKIYPDKFFPGKNQ